MQKHCTDAQAKEWILEVGRRMFQRNLVATNDGNISCRVDDGSIWITPSGVSKGYMTEEMLLRVDMDGNILEGTYEPTSEMKMHLRVYRENPDVGGVTHAHPLAATAFAAARIPLDMAVLPEAIVNLGVVPVAEYATMGTQAVADSIAPFCNTHNAALLANHGAVTWGRDLWEAYYRLESLESCANILIHLGYLNRPAALLTRRQVQELVDIRSSKGVKAGEFPVCAEDL